MRAKEFISELNINNHKGWGSTPKNIDIDYFGLVVKMRPSVFLNLAAHLPIDDEAEGRIAAMIKHHQSGGEFAAPTLDVKVPAEWREGDLSKFGEVMSHEGRHRLNAHMRLNGDVPVETHIVLCSDRIEWRSRHITPEMVEKLNEGMYAQVSKLFVKGPLFS